MIRQPRKVEVDPFFQEIPWDIVQDDNGKVIGEVYLLPMKRKKSERRDERNDRANKRGAGKGYTGTVVDE